MNGGHLTSSTFSLNVRRTTIAQWPLGDDNGLAPVPTIGEVEQCGFAVLSPEADVDYQIRVGDEELEESIAADFGDRVLWQQRPHFESARGRVAVLLLSRPIGSSERWRKRAEALVNVLPTKLGEERYEAMFESLRSVSVGLVFDLLSKGRLQLSLSGIGSISSRPANAELVVLDRLWSTLSHALQQIAVQPETGLRLTRETRLCWGNERLGPMSLRDLARSGVDPRTDSSRPFRATRERLDETSDIYEHRIILGFLKLLRERIRDCGRRARQHLIAIERERPFRDIDQADGSNIYNEIDLPKIERLRIATRRAEDLDERIRGAENLPFLNGVRPDLRQPHSPIFGNVLPYRRFRDEMLRYLSTSLAILDDGIKERAKSTSRMYEQWTFLQVLAALRACGLSALKQEGLLTRSTQDRFTIDIERGARVWFACPDGRTLSARYEPWIHPAGLARSLHDTVYRGRSGESSWSPDILIELMAGPNPLEPLHIDYAVVIDGKYTRNINQRHRESVQKYNEIRSTATDRPVVKQVWLAHPSESGIMPWDEAVEWTAFGPNRPRDENVNGTLGIMPPADTRGSGFVNETVREFMKSVLLYLGIPEASAPARAS